MFSKSVSTPTKPADEAETSEDDAELEQSHDPHFEPIVPLPAAIQVRTGEEEETRGNYNLLEDNVFREQLVIKF